MTTTSIDAIKRPTCENPTCPRYNLPMAKAGHCWSGHNRRQRFVCTGCGTANVRKNGNGSSPTSNNHSLQEVTMPRAGGEDTFLDKPKICPADSNPEANARACAYHLKGHCNRFGYPHGCRLKLSREEWEALPTS